MRVQYLIDGVVVTSETYHKNDKGTAKKQIKILDMNSEHAEELRGLLERQLKNLEELEKYEKQKSPEQEYPKNSISQYPKENNNSSQ